MFESKHFKMMLLALLSLLALANGKRKIAGFFCSAMIIADVKFLGVS